MIDYTLEIATLDDVDAIQTLIYPEYFNETIYSGQEYDPENTKDVIKSWIENACIIAKKNGELIAVASMYFLKTFYKDLEAEIVMFFVKKEHRGTGISRDLVFNMVAHAERNGCKIIYTSCASGISEKNDKMYFNLFSKYGFKKLGTELVRL